MGSVLWIPELQISINRFGYHQQCRLKYCAHRQINNRNLFKWFKKSKFTHTILTADSTIKELQNGFKNCNNIKNLAPTKRKLFLETIAEARAEEGDLKKETVKKQLMIQEHQRATFHK
jgi:hypothetical protein